MSSWGWDSLHRMVSYSNANGAEVQWQYNPGNLPTTVMYPGPLNVTWGYANADRWTSIQDWNSDTSTYRYDPDTALTS
jgi:YD repeat-containing protein